MFTHVNRKWFEFCAKLLLIKIIIQHVIYQSQNQIYEFYLILIERQIIVLSIIIFRELENILRNVLRNMKNVFSSIMKKLSIYLKLFHNIIFDKNSFSNISILNDFTSTNKLNLRFWIINHYNIWVDQNYVLNKMFELLWIYFVWFNFDTSNWKNYINFFFA